MALIVPPSNEKKRVKVYELKNNDWFDRGTGFCTGRIVNVGTHKIWDTVLTGFLHWRCPVTPGRLEADLGVGRVKDLC